MTNKEFYDQLVEYVKSGMIILCPRVCPPARYFCIKVGPKLIAFHMDIVQFAKQLEAKVESHDFFTQTTLERYLGVSVSKVSALLRKEEYELIQSTNKIKFYIKKDW